MKWVTHQLTAAAAAIVLSMPPAAIGAAWAGSILPDVLDQRFAGLFRNRQKAFNRIHRGTTHWFGWWAALWLVPMFAPRFLDPSFFPSSSQPAWAVLAAGLGFGALSHVLLDMTTTSGVPLVPWSRKNKFSLGLCRTGGVSEYLFLAGFLALCWLAAGERLTPLLGQIRRWAGI